ncbi:hypothetical protein B0I35DRAFT_221005 [Stachybotrys elegans]|uniref:Uncharacterized protein n=1 Tax=Stachybotrys elegans TaxID=80388 RepID=A0A8K0WRB8_9HYPO|nr:hypothetical protein B0I35DRAFT_221005 [Stachybotrys elegans]
MEYASAHPLQWPGSYQTCRHFLSLLGWPLLLSTPSLEPWKTTPSCPPLRPSGSRSDCLGRLAVVPEFSES